MNYGSVRFAAEQKEASVQITCPGLDSAHLIHAVIHEKISEMFRIDAIAQTVSSPDIASFIGKQAYITIFLPNDKERYFSGIVADASIENVPNNDEKVKICSNIVRLTIVPTVFKSSLTKKYRLFQEKSCVDIIKEVLKENGITNNEVKLSITTKINCCVQYGESDFDFIVRLLSAVGGIFFFKHEKNKDTFCITDTSTSGVKLVDKLAVRPNYHQNDLLITDVINLSSKSGYGIKKVDMFSYNEEKHQVIAANGQDSDKNSIGAFELYAQEFVDASAGNKLAKNIVEGSNSEQNTITGSSFYPMMCTGSIVSIEKSAIKSQNGDFLITECTHIINEISEQNVPLYQNKFTAIPSKVNYKPSIMIRRKKIGPQTAIVTGPSGEEIFCDDDGRVKVKFIWDSRAKNDDKSSYWVRVAHFLANKNYGSYYIPRIGSEVCVLFVNQDADIHTADIPIIVSSFYNGVNKPHYKKADNTVMALYTNSTKGGKGFNEFRINDKKDSELVYFHMQKDYEKVIEHNMTTTIEKGDALFTNKEGNVTYIVKKGDDKYQNEKGNVTALMDDGNYTFTLKKGKVAIAIQNGDVSIEVNGNVDVTVKKNVNVKITGDLSVEAKNIKIKANAAYTLNATQDITIDTKKNLNASSAMNTKITAKMNMNFEAKMNYEVKATMNATIKATMNVNIEATMNFTLKGNIQGQIQAMAMLKLNGSAMVQVQGGMIKLN